MLHSNITYIIYKKAHLDWVKMGSSHITFIAGKYHINAMEIVNLLPKNFLHLYQASNFPWFTILLLLFYKRNTFRIFGHFRGIFK